MGWSGLDNVQLLHKEPQFASGILKPGFKDLDTWYLLLRSLIKYTRILISENLKKKIEGFGLDFHKGVYNDFDVVILIITMLVMMTEIMRRSG